MQATNGVVLLLQLSLQPDHFCRFTTSWESDRSQNVSKCFFATKFSAWTNKVGGKVMFSAILFTGG